MEAHKKGMENIVDFCEERASSVLQSDQIAASFFSHELWPKSPNFD